MSLNLGRAWWICSTYLYCTLDHIQKFNMCNTIIFLKSGHHNDSVHFILQIHPGNMKYGLSGCTSSDPVMALDNDVQTIHTGNMVFTIYSHGSSETTMEEIMERMRTSIRKFRASKREASSVPATNTHPAMSPPQRSKNIDIPQRKNICA